MGVVEHFKYAWVALSFTWSSEMKYFMLNSTYNMRHVKWTICNFTA